MTQIRSVALPTRRAGELGVHSLDHFDLTVPDLKVADHYYGAFGLDLHPQRESLTVHTAGGSHCWGRISEGPRKKLNYLSFGAFADDVPAFKARLEALGVKLLDPPPGVDSAGLWFRNPDGLLIEIKVAEKSSPNEKSSIDLSSAPAGAQGAPKRSQVSLVRPRRLAHILIFTSDVGGAIKFYTRTLGLRLADRSGTESRSCTASTAAIII
ncbi:catechol 2,3-dioxygenase-like lactoylglutathione lyase family enzyme [Rhodoligotrophos appendicifer]|uniref:VOC family protein n=1 Tax=Rhodoligotrophos appendicifer TaxID=987056 RepID=UPI00195FD08A|nr:VOC family protein [Rhodoligotrophos appendicifer]